MNFKEILGINKEFLGIFSNFYEFLEFLGIFKSFNEFSGIYMNFKN
jgi:hypothetical protein